MIELRLGNIISIGLAAVLFIIILKWVLNKAGRSDIAQMI